MQLKSYIAIFLAVVFFGKFIMLDPKVLNSILDTEEITLVNPLCKKKNKESGGSDTYSKESSIFIISSGALCNTLFYLSKISLPQPQKVNNYQDFGYLNPAVTSTYFSKNYPPPKA